MFLAGSLKGIGYEGSDVNTVLLLADNQAAIKLANNPINHPRAKHIDIQYHKVRELISDVVPELDYIETSKMVADGLTKPLTLVKHEYFITMLGLAEKSEELAQIGLNRLHRRRRQRPEWECWNAGLWRRHDHDRSAWAINA